MSDKIQAASDLQRFMNMFQGLDAIVESLHDVGSLELAGKEAQKNLDSLTQLAKDKLDEYKKQEQEHAANLQALVDAGSKEVADAKAEAKMITDGAAAEAGEILGAAHEDAKKMRDAAQVDVTKAKRELNDLKVWIDSAKVDLADINRDKDISKREHARLTLLIHELKARFELPGIEPGLDPAHEDL